MDVVGHVAGVHHLVAQQHTGQQADVIVDFLHRKARGLREVVAQHLHLVPGEAAVGWSGQRVQSEKGRGGPACSSCLQ